jgi:hypothetical protein
MRRVADTNTVVFGLLWQGPPRSVLDAARAGAIEVQRTVNNPAVLGQGP